MNVLELENQKTILQQKLEETYSSRRRLILIYEFYKSLLSLKKISQIEPYIVELIDEYNLCLEKFDVTGVHPKVTSNIITQAKHLETLDFLQSYSEKTTQILISKEEELRNLEKVLDGQSVNNPTEKRTYFLVMEDEHYLGMLESVTVKVSAAKNETKFLVIPSGKEIEERIHEQINNSWEAAKGYVKKYIRKLNPHHEVIIKFDRRTGDYIGNSLGIALTISFIGELLSFYNAPTVVTINEKVAFTGGNGKDGKIKSISKEIIQRKIETIFYSDIKTFIIPKEDEKYALTKYEELKREFPNRAVDIIPITSLHDLLNRRNIINIKKQKFPVRAYKYSKKNWVSLTLLFILTAVLVVFGLIDFDTNPAILENEGHVVFVKNKNGKVLWNKKLLYDYNDKVGKSNIRISQKIVDINNDGVNEVLLTDEDLSGIKNTKDYYRVACFNNKGNLIWKYNFKDSVLSDEGYVENRYVSYLVDTLTEKGIKELFLFSTNYEYPSAVYKLNLLNGKRLKGTLWSQGHFEACIIGDFNKDSNNELVAGGINNGCERCFLLSINIDSLYGQTPTLNPDYYFLNKRISKFNNYILLPKSDYCDYFNVRFNSILRGDLYFQSDINRIETDIEEGDVYKTETLAEIGFHISPSFNNIDIIIGDYFHVRRDSLVAKGILKPPYTNTKDYINILKNQVRYWNGGKFVKKEGLK